MAREPIGKHGRDHRPEGHDPSFTGLWHKAGNSGEPAFQNGWSGKFWFRLVVGPNGHENQSLEVVMAVDGGTPGSIITTLTDGFYLWADGQIIPGTGHDSTGAFRAYHIDGSNGNVIDGTF